MPPPPEPFDPVYIAARRVLLNALDALAPYGRAVIVAGAQAIYLHAGTGGLAVAPYTTDGDLALDPTLLVDEPQLETVMREAGFDLLRPQPNHPEPGIWVATAIIGGKELIIPVDLIVREGAAGPGGRRGARLGAHGNRAARRAVGLEAALVDHAPMTVVALDPNDRRSFEVEVAGPAALLIAKAHKIHDRLNSPRPGRVEDKDAADVYRLMQTTSPAEIGARLAELEEHEVAGAVTRDAIAYLMELFGRRSGEGVQMAARTFHLAIPEAQISSLATTYVARMASRGSDGVSAR